ncbi:MAG: DUF4129 domain-containing protein [Trueperella sp.]|nr:DUF4129 domain-containing protein [Trueperella sp.]
MLFCSAPLTPDADTAREWAEHELSKGKYKNNDIFERFLDWLLAQLTGKQPQFGDGIPVAKILVAAALVLLVLLVTLYLVHLWRGRRSVRQRRARHPLFDDEHTAAELFAAADAATDARIAVIERYRGIIRLLDERELLNIHPGMTALEASTAASRILGAADLFDRCANAFNRAYYSELAITPAHAAAMAELARHCQNAVEKISPTPAVGGK